MMPISILTLPRWPGPAAQPGKPADLEDEFKTALSRLVPTPVLRQEAHLRDALPDRFIIAFQRGMEEALADCPIERRVEIAARTIDMDARWPNAFRMLEQHHLAAAVDITRYYHWGSHQDSDFGGQIMGLTSVAERAGMTYESGSRYGSDHYGLLSCREHCRDLPSLLVHYLTVYEEMGLHLRSQSS